MFNQVDSGRTAAMVITSPLLLPATAGKFAVTTLGINVGGWAGGKGGKFTGEITAPESQKTFIQNRTQFKEGMQAGNKAEFSTDVNWFRGIARQTSGVRLIPFIAGDKPAFESGVRTYYKGLGYKGEDLSAAVSASSRQRFSGEIGGVVGVFGANVGTELLSPTLKSISKFLPLPNHFTHLYCRTYNIFP